MLNMHFFDIPIYKKSEKDFIKERTKKINKKLKQYKGYIENLNTKAHFQGKSILDLDKYLKEYEVDQLKIGGGWLYNQISDWLYIYFDGKLMPIIRYPVGDRAIWIEPTGKKNRKFKKSVSKLFEIQLLSKIRKHSQQELALVLTQEIEEKFYSNYSKKKKYIYLDTFRNILTYLDIGKYLEDVVSNKQ